MELIHAYSPERIERMSEAYVTGLRMIKGTAIAVSMNSNLAIAADANGLHGQANGHTFYVDISSAIDPSRVTSYWVTVGFLVLPESGGSGTWTSAIFGINGTGIITPGAVFAETNYQQAYVEFAMNPITGELRVYVNGKLMDTVKTWSVTERLVRIMYGPGFSYFYAYKDIYVARFEANEVPCLRRWKSVTLPAVTNDIGSNAALQTVDGTQVSVGVPEVKATYNIPASTLGICVQSSMLSPDNLSDLVTSMADGTVTKTTRNSNIPNQITTSFPRTGHALHVGQMTPTANATTLTVGVKAVDRA